MLDQLTTQLAASRSLDPEQTRLAVGQLVDEKIPASVKAEFLTALARKGETTAEIAEFARALRDMSITPPLDAETRAREILDVCGTGGDRLGTFNISTTVAIVCAAAGVAVAKHGNRAITSQAGSADVLEALGVRIDLPPPEAARSLREHNFAFFFAPNYHPAFKHIAPARKLCAERGQRTIFNFLGPLLNPTRPTFDASPNTEPAYLDELSALGPNTIAEFYQERGFACWALAPEQFPLQRAALADLLGGDGAANAEIVRRLLGGDERGPKRDAVLLNAGAALLVAGCVRSLSEGWDLAGEIIDGGKAQAKLRELVADSGLA